MELSLVLPFALAPLQFFCLGNPTDREAWRATVHGVTGVGHDWATEPTIHLLLLCTSTPGWTLALTTYSFGSLPHKNLHYLITFLHKYLPFSSPLSAILNTPLYFSVIPHILKFHERRLSSWYILLNNNWVLGNKCCYMPFFFFFGIWFCYS